MSFEVLPALVAGLIGTGVMSALMAMAASMGMTKMPPMPLLTGSMMSGDRAKASRMGTMVHYIVMGTVMFGLVYAGLFTAIGSASVVVGVGIGLAHGVLVGAMAMPMMALVHPRMSEASGADRAVVTEEAGEIRIAAPGFFGIKWGVMTPMGMIVGHVVFGVVVALIYDALV